MKNKNPYENFPNYVLRTALFSFDFYKELTAETRVSDEQFRTVFLDPVIAESFFLASPDFFQEILRWQKGDLTDEKKQKKLKLSILRYLSRMSSRCTPFGLFAGCSYGTFSDKTSIELKKPNQHKRHTRFDMNFLVELSQDLAKDKNIRCQLLFYPNTSSYRIADELRYVQYIYKEGKRSHQIVAAEHSSYLDAIVSKAKEGASLGDIASILVDEEISIGEAAEFVEELVKEQFLVSELEPSVSGPEFLEQIISVLDKLNGIDHSLSILKNVKRKLKIIDKNIGNDPQKYIDIADEISELGTKFDIKHLFQVDMILEHKENVLNKNIVNIVKNGIALLNKITLPPQAGSLDNFKKEFYERFEEREVTLAMALDPEIGLQYDRSQDSGDVNPLVDDLVLKNESNVTSNRDVRLSSINDIFHMKLCKALTENVLVIHLVNEDFAGFECNWDDLPDTFYSLVEIIDDKGIQKLKHIVTSGSSAANLLGRFCHSSKELLGLTEEIILKENKINKSKILAEIVHLPESRVGNVLMRPDFRKYEIPYLAKSIKTNKYQLCIDDLRLSMKSRNKIFLRSEKYDKEVLPHLTNAHSYYNNSLPIYNFLANLQKQNKRNGLGIDLGPFVDRYLFIPRIEYDDVILFPATWNLKNYHLDEVLCCRNDDETFRNAIKTKQRELRLPQFVLLSEKDNELLINFENLTSVEMLIDSIGNKSQFTLKEFLYNENSIVRQDDKFHTNQVLIPFYNSTALINVI